MNQYIAGHVLLTVWTVHVKTKKIINNCGIVHVKHNLTIFLNIRVFTREIKNLLR